VGLHIAGVLALKKKKAKRKKENSLIEKKNQWLLELEPPHMKTSITSACANTLNPIGSIPVVANSMKTMTAARLCRPRRSALGKKVKKLARRPARMEPTF
jgi:hypothetical protein